MSAVLFKLGAGRWLRSIRQRFRALTARQAAVLAVASVLGAASAVAALAGWPALATLPLGAMNFMIILGLLQLRRRLREEIQSLMQQHARSVQRVEAAQRRILAAVENERLAAAEWQQTLLGVLNQSAAGEGAASVEVPTTRDPVARGR